MSALRGGQIVVRPTPKDFAHFEANLIASPSDSNWMNVPLLLHLIRGLVIATMILLRL